MINDYCSLQPYLPRNKITDDSIRKIPTSLFKYIEATETTKICECPYEKPQNKKDLCWTTFSQLKE